MSFSVCSVINADAASPLKQTYSFKDSASYSCKFTSNDTSCTVKQLPSFHYQVSGFTFSSAYYGFEFSFLVGSDNPLYNLDPSRQYVFDLKCGVYEPGMNEMMASPPFSDVIFYVDDLEYKFSAVSLNRTSDTANIHYRVTLPSGLSKIDKVAFTYDSQMAAEFKTINFNFNIPFTLTSVGENDDVIANDNKNHEEVKGFWNNLFSKLGDWFKGLLDGILNGLKSLFIPTDGFMEKFFSDVDKFLKEHLGALYYPFSVMVDILQKILAFRPPDNPSITLPELSFPVNGTTYTLWKDTVYNFDLLKDEPFKTIYNLYLMAVDCMFAFALVKLFKKKLDEVMTG